MKKALQVSLLPALLLMLWVSGCEQVGDPLTLSQFQIDRNVSMFSNTSTMLDRRIFYRFETIFFTFENLYPSEQTDIQIVRLNDNNIIKRLLVFTDPDGAIRNLPIWYYVGHRGPGDVKDERDDYAVHLLQPGIDRPWKIYFIPFEIRDSYPPTAQMRLTDPDGRFLGGSVFAGNGVYVEGSNFPVHKVFKLLVVADKTSYTPGEAYVDITGDGIESRMVDRDGAFPPTLIWNNAALGAYDIIADGEPYGIYDAGDVILDPLITGLVVQNKPVTGHIIADIACDEFGVYRDVFDSLETVYAKVNLQTKPPLASEFVTVYVTPHKDEWKKGDPLVAMSTVGTFEMPLACLWNGFAGSLPVIKTHGLALPDDPSPRKMWPGEYDVIIDVDRNYFYDPGIDILDGGIRPAFTVPGKVPEIRFGASADLDFLGRFDDDPNRWGYFRDEIHTSVWGLVVDSLGVFRYRVPVDFKVVQGPGHLDRDLEYTDDNGAAYSIFTGGQWGRGTLVRLDATVADQIYTKHVLIFRKIPHTHNQGIVIGY